MSVVAQSLTRLRAATIFSQARRTMSGKGGDLPLYDPAAAIPMKWGAVYMAVFMGFWGLAYVVSPFRDRHTMTDTYEKKWQGQ